MANYKVRLRTAEGKIINKVINTKGFLKKRLVEKQKVYVFDKRDVDRVPYYVEAFMIPEKK